MASFIIYSAIFAGFMVYTLTEYTLALAHTVDKMCVFVCVYLRVTHMLPIT